MLQIDKLKLENSAFTKSNKPIKFIVLLITIKNTGKFIESDRQCYRRPLTTANSKDDR